MTAFLLSLATFLSTLAGGLCALKFRDRLHLLLGFAAGVLLGVVAFDLLPESFALSHRLGGNGQAAMLGLAGGFLLLHALEKSLLVHAAQEGSYAPHRHPHAGMISALALIAHSFMDGIGIGLAFQVSNAVGLTIAIAVIAHDFCDGMNTVSLMLVHRNTTQRALGMLVLDAGAPILGVTTAFVCDVPGEFLVVYLGLFAGFLLYIGVSDILPQAHSRAGSSSSTSLIGLTALGVSFIYVVMRVTG